MEYKVINEALTIYLKGAINSGNCDVVEQEIEDIMGKNQFNSVVFDFDKVDYISSAGLRIILRIKQKYPETKVINTSESIYSIFEMVGFTTVMTVKRK